MRVAEVTIATGIVALFGNPDGGELTALSSRWAIAIVAGAFMAFVAYGILRGALKPAIERLLAIAPTAADGDAGGGAGGWPRGRSSSRH
jgi:hydroxymethylglutaryl-CoA reductase